MPIIPDPDRRRALREPAQPSTFSQFAQSQADDETGGRFAARGKPMMVGSEQMVRYPQLPASSPWAGPDPVPVEPPTGYAIDEMVPLEPASLAQAPGGSPDAPSSASSMSERGGPPLSQEHDDVDTR
jgi:hypothetical protein